LGIGERLHLGFGAIGAPQGRGYPGGADIEGKAADGNDRSKRRRDLAEAVGTGQALETEAPGFEAGKELDPGSRFLRRDHPRR
jgi:hypothetical protein